MLITILRLIRIIPASNFAIALMMALFLFSSLLEVLGIGSIAPFINLATNPELLRETPWLETIYLNSGIGEPTQFVALLGLVVILLFCGKTLISWLTQVMIFRFSARQQKLLVDNLVDKYLAAPYNYYLKRNSSEIIDNIIEIANRFIFILQPLFFAIANAFVLVALISLLFYTSSITVTILLIIILPVLWLINSFRQTIANWGRETRDSKQQMIKIISHSLGGIKETKIIGCEAYFSEQIKLQSQRLEKSSTNFASFNILPRFLIETVMVIAVVGVVCYFVFIGENLDRLNGVLGVFAIASIRMLPAFSGTIGGLNTLRNNSYTVDRIWLDLQELAQLKDNYLGNLEVAYKAEARPQQLAFNDCIELENISYRYAARSEYAIDGLSLTIQKGESIAFIGKSGAGKTTLVDLVLGLLIPQQGNLRVDGVSVYGNLRAWQDTIGYIPQSIFLTDDTLRRNIAFGVPDNLIDEAKVWQAIAASQLTEVVDSLDRGLSTRVGERGVLLSGGQRQRVGIARALYHEREILVLDEATAALDNDTEKLVTEAINSLSGQKTLITIAHRLTTVEKCDRIFLIEEGKIVKSGNYQSVVSG